MLSYLLFILYFWNDSFMIEMLWVWGDVSLDTDLDVFVFAFLKEENMREPEGFFCGLKVTWVPYSSSYILTCVLGTFPFLGSRNLDERELESSSTGHKLRMDFHVKCKWCGLSCRTRVLGTLAILGSRDLERLRTGWNWEIAPLGLNRELC